MQPDIIGPASYTPPPGLPDPGTFPAQIIREDGRDPVMERLVRALLPENEAREVLRGFYTVALHSSLMKRLADLRCEADPVSEGRKAIRLPAWRLRRVYELVEKNLGGRLTLADLAGAAGLSRMHFAAQFRAATGMRPHDYISRRRIQRAKAMLAGTDASIVDIALSTGFQTQSHFCTVFKHVAGVTPKNWRSLSGQER